MASQDIGIWADEIQYDDVKGGPQRKQIAGELTYSGWLRIENVTAQDLNQLFNIISHYNAPSDICPYDYPDSQPIPANALAMGSAITEEESPYLFAAYGSTLPTMTSQSGFIKIVRNH